MTRNLTESIFPNSELIFVGKTNVLEISNGNSDHLLIFNDKYLVTNIQWQIFGGKYLVTNPVGAFNDVNPN